MVKCCCGMASVFARVLSAAGLALWSSQAPIPLVGVHLSRRGVQRTPSYSPGLYPGDRLRRTQGRCLALGRPRDYSSRTPQRTGSHSSGGSPSFSSRRATNALVLSGIISRRSAETNSRPMPGAWSTEGLLQSDSTAHRPHSFGGSPSFVSVGRAPSRPGSCDLLHLI